MWIENSPVRALRTAARRALPERAFLKRDRGAALFVTNAPAFRPALDAVPGFLVERRGALLRLWPDVDVLLRLERRYPEPPSDFCATFQRFAGVRAARAEIELFVCGAKLLDADAPDAQARAAYDRALRARAAGALRGEPGGGLYACALIGFLIYGACAEDGSSS